MAVKNKKKLILKYLLLLFSVFAVFIFIEPYRIEDKTYIIENNDIPKAFENTRIIYITDIHHGPFFDINRVKKLVDSVNSKNPDLILLGGDYVQRDPKYIIPCFNELKKLKAPLGIYGVLGNHDHWEDAGLTKKMMMESGIVDCDNNAFWINRERELIKIGGVGDYNEDIQDIAPTVGNARKEDFVILLTHNPDYVENMPTDKVDLIFAGHTHGGQMTVFGLWAPLIPSKYGQKYRTGLIHLKNSTMIVSNGVGTVTPPVRFFARPQIVTVILKRKQQ